MRSIEIVAHRGANSLAPENTLSAIRHCLELGVEYIELDVRQSRDGVFYNFHNSILERTTNGRGLLCDQMSHTIDSLDAGINFGHQFAGERVPRIDEVLPM